MELKLWGTAADLRQTFHFIASFVDEEEGDIDDGSDVELDLDLDSEHNDDDLESDSVYWI